MPSVIEKLVIFVKELLFPQTAPIDDVFFQPDWAGVCWGRWAGPGLMWTGRKSLDRRAGDRTAAGLVCRLWM